MSPRPTALLLVLVAAMIAGPAGAADDPFDVVFPTPAMEDPTTLQLERTFDRIVDSEVAPGTRLRAIGLEFRSFSWAEEDWTHEAVVVFPADGIPDHARGKGVVVAGFRPYADAAASLLGIPALLITSGNPGPHYSEPKEGGLMGQSLERMVETGDPRWNGYAWLGKVMVRGVTVMAALPETRIEEAVVTGCSKRGMAAWIAAAADRRVVGAFPTCWNTGNYRESSKLLVDRLGADYRRGGTNTKAPAFVSAREQYERTLHPQFERLAALTDPALWGERIADKAILYAFGTNDPLYHVLSCNLLLPELEGEKRVLLVPNTEHTPDTPQHLTAWTMWVAHVLLGRDVPEIVVDTDVDGSRLTVDARVTSSTTIDKLELWWATDPAGRYNGSTWQSTAMSGRGDRYRATLPRSPDNHLALFVAVHDDDPATGAGYITSRPVEILPTSGE